MRKLKILFYLIILLFLTIIVASNATYFISMTTLDFNIYLPLFEWPVKFYKKVVFTVPPVATGVYFLGCFVVGALFIYIKTLIVRFQSSRQIKALENDNRLNQTKIADLKKEVDFLQRNASKPSPPKTAVTSPSEKPETDAKEAANGNGETKTAENA